VRNNPAYTTALASVSNLDPLACTFILIYIRNPFNFNFILLNRSIKGILTFIAFILFSFTSQVALSPCSWSITACNYPLVINVKSASKLSAILVSPPCDVVAADNNTTALGSILLNLSCLL